MAPSLPTVNWYKLNTNGSFLGNPGKARGGLVCAIGSTSSVIVELWALRDGLSLFNQFHIQSLNIELDASIIINLLCNNNRFSRTLSPLIDDCRVLLIRILHHKIQHCIQEANRCADTLARMGARMLTDFVSFVIPPSCILDQIRIYALGAVYVGAAVAVP